MRLWLAKWLLKRTKYHVVRKYNRRIVIKVPQITPVTLTELIK